VDFVRVTGADDEGGDTTPIDIEEADRQAGGGRSASQDRASMSMASKQAFSDLTGTIVANSGTAVLDTEQSEFEWLSCVRGEDVKQRIMAQPVKQNAERTRGPCGVWQRENTLKSKNKRY
jgi:hypothetical protein